MTDQNVNTTTQLDQASQSQSAGQQNSSFAVPEAYKDRGYVDKIKSSDDLWKAYDNSQSLLGKRPAGIPANDATPEEWDKFYQAAGRPDRADKYTLPEIEGIPEGVDIAPVKQQAMEIMHKSGLTQRQAEALWKNYMGAELGAVAKSKEAQAEQKKTLDAEFDKLTQDHFGGDFESAQKITIEMANKFVPAELRGAFGELGDNPKALAAIASLAKSANAEIERVKKEYGAEGTITSGSQTASKDIDTVRKELAALRTSPEARDFLNPKHKETTDRITELSGLVQKHYKTS